MQRLYNLRINVNTAKLINIFRLGQILRETETFDLKTIHFCMAAVIDKIFKKKRKQLIANDEINEQLVREHYARQEKDVSGF
jgi:transposase